MKVLMVIKKLRYSGAYKMFMWVAKALADRGFEVTVFTYMRNDVTELPVNINWIKVDLENKGFVSQFKAVRKVVKRVRPSCVISFLLDANILNMLACLGTRAKSVVCERNDPFKPHYTVMKIAKPFFRLADGAVFQLPKVAEFYKEIKHPTAIIPNPVLCRSDISISTFEKRDNNIVTLARLDVFQKRLDILIDAFSIFIKSHPDYTLTIYGDGPDKEKLEKQIANLNLNESVILGGVSYSPQESIKNSKFFILSSDFEGIPNALMEAMSIGLPCISTDCRPGGAALLVKHSVNGLLIPPHDVESLAKQMCSLAEHPVEADAMGLEAKKIVTEFAEDKIAQMWCDYIKTFRKNEDE